VQADAEADVARLQAVLRDLVALSAIPAVWIGSEPPGVAAGLAEALVGLLQLDFAFVRLRAPDGDGAIEATRGSGWASFPDWLEGRLADGAPFLGKEVVPDVGGGSARRSGFVVSVGVNGEDGVVAAASDRTDFPTRTDQLLLSVAANYAAVAFQSARLIYERRRAEDELRTARNELEVKVAERTAELRVANDELSALRRVATLVAKGVQPAEIFSAVTDEVRGLFRWSAAVVRFEAEGPAIVFVGIARTTEQLPVGTRWGLDDSLASAEVYRTGRSARVDARDWSIRSGPVAEAGRRMGIVSTVACPIIVEGHLWGAVTVASTDERLPVGVESRLEKFTELIATAIANADSRSELAASRRRIVAASDEARRRIERDLHDGTQQRLISVGLAMRAAEADVPPDRGDLRAALSRIATDLSDAVADLQEISRGIHPAIISHGGLGPALRTLARRSTIPIQLEVTTRARLPEPIEVAAYYVASEALANATKHAQASEVELSLATGNGSLLLSIRDDGVGGADPAGGSGLIGLSDRVQALGGSICVTSRPGEGTHVAAELPLELEDASTPHAPIPPSG
jgi:signal transduction histidine kinase